MGNPVKVELELSGGGQGQGEQQLPPSQGAGAEHFGQQRYQKEAGGESFCDQDAPLLASNAKRAEESEAAGGGEGNHLSEVAKFLAAKKTGAGAEEDGLDRTIVRVKPYEDDVKALGRPGSPSSNNGGTGSPAAASMGTRGTFGVVGQSGSGSGSGGATPSSLGDPVREEDITSDVIREMERKYAPFVRDDIYGTYGRGPLPFLEKVFVGLALVTIVPIRFIFLILILVVYYCICKVCTLFRHPGEEEGQENYVHLTGLRRRVIVFTGRWLARTLLFCLGFYRIKVVQKSPDAAHQRLHQSLDSQEPEKERARDVVVHFETLFSLLSAPTDGTSGVREQDNEVLLGSSRGLPGAIVSNHISYLDILYHMSASFPSFVAKKSVAKLPLVGLMSKCMGCVYVQRESKAANFKGVSGIVTERLLAAHSNLNAPIFLLFPEGTTSNGDYLLPFKTGAFLAGTPVQPLILKYPYERFSPAWETMTGVRHIILLLCQVVNYLEVTKLPAYYPTAKECQDPKLYANSVRNLMSTEGNMIISEVGLHEKRVYHAALAGKVFSRSESSLT